MPNVPPSLDALQQTILEMKEAIRLLQDFANRSPTTRDVAANVAGLDILTTARFDAEKRYADGIRAQREYFESKIEALHQIHLDKNALLLAETVKQTTERLATLEKNQYGVGQRASGRSDFLAWIVTGLTILGSLVGLLTFLATKA